MKKILTLTTLTTKLLMLLCVSGMGIFSVIDSVTASVNMPCHVQVESTNKKNIEPCQMCETALDSLDMDGVFALEVSDSNYLENFLADDSAAEPIKTKINLSLDNYQVYYPPPDVLVKSVTPITKTIVLIV